MERYKFFDHTADAKFQAFGKNLEEAFSNAALAMTSIMLNLDKIRKQTTRSISVEGSDLKSLLYNFLEELLFLIDTEGFVLAEVKDLKIDGYKLSATLVGDVLSDRYETAGDVKAITYNDMEIRQNPGDCMVQVVVDL